jgi:hypothetical protein
VRTTADVDVTIAVKRNSELHELIKKVGVYFVGEVFIASSVNYHIQDGTILSLPLPSPLSSSLFLYLSFSFLA